MADDDIPQIDSAFLARDRMEQARDQASAANLRAYARRTAIIAGVGFTSDLVDECRRAYFGGQQLGKAMDDRGMGPVPLQRALLDFSRTASGHFQPAFVAGMVSRLSVSTLIAYRNTYDETVGDPSFPPAARDLTRRTSPDHPSASQPKEPDLTGYPDTLLTSFQDGLIHMDGVSPSGRSRPGHVTRLLLPMTNNHADLATQDRQIRAFMAARKNAGDGTVAAAVQLPAHVAPSTTKLALAAESVAAALYLHSETPRHDGLPPLNTLVVLDPSGPRQPSAKWDGTSQDPREWLADVIRSGAVEPDAVVVCGGGGQRRDLSEWRLPKRLPLLDYRGTALGKLPLGDIERKLTDDRAAALRGPRNRATYLRQFEPTRSGGWLRRGRPKR